MSDRQSVLQAVGRLPESATWGEITDAVLAAVARTGSAADFGRAYRATLTAEQLAEYLNPAAEFSLDGVLAEFEAASPVRTSA